MRRLRAFSFAFLVVACIALLLTETGLSSPAYLLTVTYINVGQGDSELIHDSNDYNILIDGGPTSAGATVVSYLDAHSIDNLDMVIATHPDADHIGGLITVLNTTRIAISHVIYNGYPGTTATWTNFNSAVTGRGLHLEVMQYPMTYTWGASLADFHILNPAPGLVSPETNSASIVIRMDQFNIHYLFTGDIDSTIEATVVARGTPVAAQILKVAHHGSAYSSSQAFLEAVDPAEAIVSVGHNSYGHPSPDTLMRLLTSGARLWRTDQNGNITVVSDGVTYSISADKFYQLFLSLVFR